MFLIDIDGCFSLVLLQTSEAKDYFNIIDKLHNDLLTNYNKQIRPVKNHTDAINVNAGLRLTNLHFVSIIIKCFITICFIVIYLFQIYKSIG